MGLRLVGGAAVTGDRHESARHWREVILGIAKEEMGHLITVQNILRLIGGPLHLEREDYPFRSDFYPFYFKLEPATKDSLAKYVVAEAPAEWLTTKEAAPIVERVHREMNTVLQDPAVADKLRSMGFVPYAGGTLKQTQDYIAAQHAAWGKLVQRIRPRYNSEYVWNIPALTVIGGLALDYHTKPTWIIQP